MSEQDIILDELEKLLSSAQKIYERFEKFVGCTKCKHHRFCGFENCKYVNLRYALRHIIRTIYDALDLVEQVWGDE